MNPKVLLFGTIMIMAFILFLSLASRKLKENNPIGILYAVLVFFIALIGFLIILSNSVNNY